MVVLVALQDVVVEREGRKTRGLEANATQASMIDWMTYMAQV